MESFSKSAAGQEVALYKIFQQRSTWQAFSNTIISSITATVLAVIIGGALAWLEVKSDFPFKRSIYIFSMAAFIIPPYILGIAWVQFFGRNGF